MHSACYSIGMRFCFLRADKIYKNVFKKVKINDPGQLKEYLKII